MPKETMPRFSPEEKQKQKEMERFEEDVKKQVKQEKGVIKGLFTSEKNIRDKMHEQALKEKEEREIEEREIEQVTFDEVLKETMIAGVRTLKTDDAVKSELPNLLKTRIINNNEAQKLLEKDYVGGGSARSHLMRLLAKGNILGLERQGGFSNAEHSFAHAFLKYGKKIGTKADQNNEINIRVVGEETKNTCEWWTHAPYVYETLLERGIEPEKAFRKTLLWGNLKDPNHDDLLGLEELKKLDQEGSGNYILSPNPQGASHRFAKKMARKVVDEILKESD